MYKGTTFQKMGSPLTRYFSQVPVVGMCSRAILTTQRNSGLITLQIVWFSYTAVQVYMVFLSCIETHVSHVCVRKIMLILIER